MTDVVDRATRSRMMSGIKGKNTRPELLVRQFLHSQGLRFRLHAKNLPGCPDIVLPKWRVAIFVHGCFWHRHKGCRFSTMPASNTERWMSKFEKNIARDQRSKDEILAAGWKVVVLWECGLKDVEAGKKNLLWLLDYIRDKSSVEQALEWPAAADPNRPAQQDAVIC